MNEILKKLLENNHLTEEQSYTAFQALMEATVPPVQAAAFLTLLRVRGEQPSEITGAARLLRDKAWKIKVTKPVIVDTCGTGGDGSYTFNISTGAAILAAGCGLTVAKHGNRAVSSNCGSADVLEAFGYPIQAPPEKTQQALERFGFAFLFAPVYHQAMKNVAEIRKQLGFRTIFNVIGPLCNPAGANVQIIGVGDYQLLKTIPPVVQKLGIRGYVLYAEDGMDEVSLTGKTFLVEVKRNRLVETEIYPSNFGFQACRKQDLKGGQAKENASILKEILTGRLTGPCRDIVVANATFALVAAGAVKSLQEGVRLCNEIIEKNIAWDRFQAVKDFLLS